MITAETQRSQRGNFVFIMRLKATLFLTLMLYVPFLWAGEATLVKPGPKDKCPVCGTLGSRFERIS